MRLSKFFYDEPVHSGFGNSGKDTVAQNRRHWAESNFFPIAKKDPLGSRHANIVEKIVVSRKLFKYS